MLDRRERASAALRTVDELLGYIIDGRPLRDVITKAAVVDRWC